MARPFAAGFVIAAPELPTLLSTSDVVQQISGVLLVGGSPDAFTALSVLLDCGVGADAITWVEDPSLAGGPAGSSQLLRAIANRAGLELPTPQHGALKDMRPNQDGSRALCVVEAPDGSQLQLEVDLVVAAGAAAPDVGVTAALEAAGLVADGRVVVGPAFETKDPCVLAAGPMAKFSRRCRVPQVCLEHHNSREVGARLADAVASAATCRPGGDNSEISATVRPLPSLTAARAVSCRLPGGWSFFLAACGAAMAAPTLVAPQGGTSLLSCSAVEGVNDEAAGEQQPAAEAEPAAGSPVKEALSLIIGSRGEVCQVAALARDGSRLSALAPALSGLIGLPFTYLAEGLGLQQLAGLGRAPFEVAFDLAARLQQGWAGVVLHDEFEGLREKLQLAACARAIEPGDKEGIEAIVMVEMERFMEAVAV